MECQGLQTEFKEFLVRVFNNCVNVFNGSQHLFANGRDSKDILTLESAVPAAARLKNNFEEGIKDSIEIWETLIDPDFGVVFD